MGKTITKEEFSLAKVDAVINKYVGKPGGLLSILEEVQNLNKHKYLPEEVLAYISKKTAIPLSRIYSVVTFYAFFNLKPQGEHSIIICRGTACHTRRSKELLEFIKKMLGIKEEESQEGEKVFLTTADKKFTIKTVACFGQCALAPVVEIDGVIYSHMTENKLKELVSRIARRGKAK
ncbi:MAG: NAD(P)H-dependent oxidoreductase subunit E [Candidatus Omnitrophica bacterium]|nr:NAD(P)H-dependent oxidoreductase subunit E [Candidatus Omnitrophota bacterium]